MKQLITMIATLACLLTPVAGTAGDAPELLNIKQDGDREVVMIGDEVFTAYNSHQNNKPYLYPIIGPTGANMTRHFPMKEGVEGETTDHPHHTGLWFAHGDVNGIDFWHKEKTAGTSNTGLNIIPCTPAKRAILAAPNQWLTHGGGQIADAETDYEFRILEDKSRVIDVGIMISPYGFNGELVFGDTKEGTMAIRLPSQLRLRGKVATGRCINSEGDKDKEAWGKRAKWVAYWGVIDGKSCGVAVFDHPLNLRHPTWWHARDYGLVAANPFGQSDFEGLEPRGKGTYTLKAGEALKLRYRFVFFASTAEEADIAGKYDQWVEETTPE